MNEPTTTAPDWLRSVADQEWFDRYGSWIEDSRLPSKQLLFMKAERVEYAKTVSKDGFALLRMLAAGEVPDVLATPPRLSILRKVWDRHYRPSEDGKACFIPAKELKPGLLMTGKTIL